MKECNMTFSAEQIIPTEYWGRDHWSTLAYIETVMVDLGEFQIGFDARMRQNRRNFRVMAQQCPRPKRVGLHLGPWRSAGPMDPVAHATRLNNGATVEGHDDWCCVQDMEAEGLLTGEPIEPGAVVRLSDKGAALVAKLRQHKASGGTFSNFKP